MRTSFPLRFLGTVQCRRQSTGALRLTLIGATESSRGVKVQLAFATNSPPDLPSSLSEAAVEQVGDRRYRIAAAGREWVIEGVAHLHRSIGAEFNEVLPARPVPWRKRMVWRALLASAAVISRMRG